MLNPLEIDEWSNELIIQAYLIEIRFFISCFLNSLVLIRFINILQILRWFSPCGLSQKKTIFLGLIFSFFNTFVPIAEVKLAYHFLRLCSGHLRFQMSTFLKPNSSSTLFIHLIVRETASDHLSSKTMLLIVKQISLTVTFDQYFVQNDLLLFLLFHLLVFRIFLHDLDVFNSKILLSLTLLFGRLFFKKPPNLIGFDFSLDF